MKSLTVYDLVRSLSDGRFHSGALLARQFEVSRSTVWKVAKALRSLDVPLNHIRGKGYQIPGGLELLDEQQILSALHPNAREALQECLILPEASSTNDVLLGRADKQGSVMCATEYQSAGRGRFGRSWQAPFGSCLTFSFSWRLDQPAASAAGMSLVVGIAIAKALESFGVFGLQVKWPNDIVYDAKKLAGVLVEISGDASGPCFLVVGIGINVRLPNDFASDQSICDLYQVSRETFSRNRLVATILNELFELLPTFFEKGLQPFLSDWKAFDALEGREINLKVGDKIYHGVASGIDESGNLQLLCDGELRGFHSGEASISHY